MNQPPSYPPYGPYDPSQSGQPANPSAPNSSAPLTTPYQIDTNQTPASVDPVTNPYGPATVQGLYGPGAYSHHASHTLPPYIQPILPVQPAPFFKRKAFITALTLLVLLGIGSLTTYLVLVTRTTTQVPPVTPPTTAGPPPTEWIATVDGKDGRIIYFLQWTNKDGNLTGVMMAASSDKLGGAPIELSYSFTGTYTSQNRTVYLNFDRLGEQKGKIQNNTLKLHPASLADGQPDPKDQERPVFHPGGRSDYEQAKQKL